MNVLSRAAEPVDDLDLLRRVGIRLAMRDFRSIHTIRVSVRQGEVTLTGQVATKGEQSALLLVVQHMAGVRHVVDRLTVQEEVANIPSAAAFRSRPRWTAQFLHAASVIVASALVAGPVGCSPQDSGRVPTFPVTGSISFQGKPMPGAFVALHPKLPQENVPSPRASVAADGSLKLSTYDGGDGAPQGEYVLTVEWYKPVKVGGDLVSGPNVVPRKYASPKTSDIVVNVTAQENSLPPIKL